MGVRPMGELTFQSLSQGLRVANFIELGGDDSLQLPTAVWRPTRRLVETARTIVVLQHPKHGRAESARTHG